MIPKKIHQVWIGPLPAPSALMETWRRAHPGWQYRVWNSERGWENQAQIDRMYEWNGKADIMRYEILEREGGICIDADSECIRPLDESFLQHECFACFENETVLPGLIATGYVGARAGSPLMRACIEGIKPQLLDLPAWKCVGPLFFTAMARGYAGLHVYPSRTFIPRHHSGTPAPGTEPIYAKQYWGSTLGYDSLPETPQGDRANTE
jgi:mannosyltransferase OCH1-like enzyme